MIGTAMPTDKGSLYCLCLLIGCICAYAAIIIVQANSGDAKRAAEFKLRHRMVGKPLDRIHEDDDSL